MPRPKNRPKKDRAKRRADIARAIENTWSALRTHLAGAVKAEGDANEEWQARCVREYGDTINTLGVELHELAKRDFRARFTPVTKKIPRL